MPKKIIFIVGPTAIGKSQIAVRLAKKVNGEIISCDSMQVYREVSVVTSKPDARQLKAVKHHLINVVSVKDNFDVAEFNTRALRAIQQVHRKEKIPIVTGGSGLYVKILLDGIFKDGQRQEQQREELDQQRQQHGKLFLYKRLKEVDPHAAQRIHANDSRRIIRALEVYSQKGQRISELQMHRQGLWGQFDIDIIGLVMDRTELYERINARVEKMFAEGAVEEIKKLRQIPLSKTGGQIIGLKEIGGYLAGEYDRERAQYLLKRNTRHFAKRQLTWFRKEKRIQWLEVGPGDTEDKVIKRMLKVIK